MEPDLTVELHRLAEHEIEARIEKAVNQAVALAIHDVFALLGVDVNDPIDLQRFRDDLRFGGVFRNAATKGFMALIAAICGGIGLSLWMALKDNMGLK